MISNLTELYGNQYDNCDIKVLGDEECHILYEELDERTHSCPLKYRETNGGDNWALFNGDYGSRVLYSVDIRTNCRYYYVPIFGSKTLMTE